MSPTRRQNADGAGFAAELTCLAVAAQKWREASRPKSPISLEEPFADVTLVPGQLSLVLPQLSLRR